MKLLIIISLLITVLFVSCAKDKSLPDYQADQLQQSISRINAISGEYNGLIISKVDNTSLGNIKLKFQAATNIQTSSSNVYNTQTVMVNGSLTFQGLTSADVTFENGVYDDKTGNFQAIIPITLNGGVTSKLSLIGQITGDQWIGSVQVTGQPDFGAYLNLSKNAPKSNVSNIEAGGTRMEQIKRTSLTYIGTYQLENVIYQAKMNFINRDNLPVQSFYKLLTPARQIDVNCNFTDFELNFPNANLDDQMGTLNGHDGINQRGKPVASTLYCQKFDNGKSDFGYDCQVRTNASTLNIHLSAQQ